MSRPADAGRRLSGIAVCAACLWLPAAAAARDLPEQTALACGPQAVVRLPAAAPRVAGAPDGSSRELFAAGEQVIVAGAGVSVGDEFYVRRVMRAAPGLRSASRRVRGMLPVRTAGWIRIVDVRGDAAVAAIVYACDGVMRGDYLEPFVLPELPLVEDAGRRGDAAVGRAAAGAVLFGQEGREVLGAGDLLVLDRGSDHGIRAGEHFLVLRSPREARRPRDHRDAHGSDATAAPIGAAVALAVRPASTTLYLVRSDREVYAGDVVVASVPGPN